MGQCDDKYCKHSCKSCTKNNIQLSPEGEAKCRGMYPPLFTDPDCSQIRWIKKCCFNFFFWNFRETTCHFSLRSQNSKYPRIFWVTQANQNVWKLLSTDLVNTNNNYYFDNHYQEKNPQELWMTFATPWKLGCRNCRFHNEWNTILCFSEHEK